MAPKKIQYMQQVQAAATQLAQALESCTSLASVYAARGYAADGANPLIADDLTGHEVTPEEIAGFVTFVAALNNVGALVPELLGYDVLLNNLRTDK